MIQYVHDNILNAADETYVIVPVSCDGKLRTALQKQWADDADALFVRQYKNDCSDRILQPGHVLRWNDSSYILAAIRQRWFDTAEYDHIEEIAITLNHMCINGRWWQDKHTDAAVPLLGAGWLGGGLNKHIVKQILEYHLMQVPCIFRIYTK